MVVTIAGVAVLVLLMADVFLTVFHAHGRAGPVTRLQTRMVWGLFRRTVRAPAVLALGAPVMVALTLLVWTLLLVLGYALLYVPWIDEFLVSPGAMRDPWWEAIYYSGYTAATLGLGDLVADSQILRLVTVAQAFSGFALVSISTTYLLATYRELMSMRSLAMNIAGYFRSVGRAGGAFGEAADTEAMARWSEGVTDRVLHSLQAHFQYPILHYFRPVDRSWALPVQLGHILRLRDAAAKDDTPAGLILRRHPSMLSLHDAVHQYVSSVGRHFVPSGHDPSRDTTEDDHVSLARLQGYMLYDS